MHCLLCHEKIPRLRAWTGKSEFCCDEHADLYKKQTMDRLLVDDSTSKGAAPALPIFDGGASSVDHVLLQGQPKKAKQAKQANETAEVDELRKLAARVGGEQEESSSELLLQDLSRASQGDVRSQSADDALAALQALAAEAVQAKRKSPAARDLLDEFSSMESSLEGLPDLAAEMGHDELAEAPELEWDALESPEAQGQTLAARQPLAQAAAADAIDAPELIVEGLAEALAESLEPPELAVEFDAEQAESLEPPDLIWQGLLAVTAASDEQDYELCDPPEPVDFDLVAADETHAAQPAPAAAPRRAPTVAPKLRPATQLHDMRPSPNLPEGGYALRPWTDALAVAGPDRSSLLSPLKFLGMRKSSLNGVASAKFDPVQFQASKRIAAVAVPISEPKSSVAPYQGQHDALTPRSAFAWPAPLHEVLTAAEMSLNGTAEAVLVRESLFSLKQPVLSAEFLSRVVLQSRILEPKRSAILSPRERDLFTSASAEEEESGGEYASAAGRSDRDETDGGERAHVADLF